MVKKNACIFISGKGSNLKNLIIKSRDYNFPIKISLVISNNKNSLGMIHAKKNSIPIKFIDTKVCEDYLFKCDLLRREKYAYCLKKYLAKYRVRDKSLQSNKLRNVYCIWKINKKYNKLHKIMLIMFL